MSHVTKSKLLNPSAARWPYALHSFGWTLFVTCLAAYTEKPAVGTSQFPVAATGNQQQVTRIKEPSSLIIDANRHYPNYNYPNSNHRHIQQRQSLHSNEPVLAYNDWSSGQMKNQTASVGRNATFECVFPDLKQDLRLAWFHKEKHTLLALQDTVIVKNGRVSVRSHGKTTFYLTIHDARVEDGGFYECQINSVPMRKKLGYLEVNVPPSFDEQLTSSDVIVREESSVNLRCKANGRPTPEISWRREDGSAINLELSNKSSTDLGTLIWKGEFLNITNATRVHSGAWICIASNRIPSPISKRIFLGVSFAPAIWSNREELGIYLGSSVVLQCGIEAYPRPNTYYWQKDDNMPPIIHSDRKYEISLLEGNTSYRFILKLKIVNVLKSDFGRYTCVAKNDIAETRTSMRLYEIKRADAPVRKAPQSRAKNIILDLFTTKVPVRNESQHESKSSSKVTDDFSLNQESAKPEVDDYETNFLKPEMGNEVAKENKATGHLPTLRLILLSSSLLLLQCVFVFAC